MKGKNNITRIDYVNTPEKAGLALKRLRKLKDLSQVDLAKMMNMRQPTISDVEKGKGTLDSFFKIVQALKINIEISNSISSTVHTGGKSKIKKLLKHLSNQE